MLKSPEVRQGIKRAVMDLIYSGDNSPADVVRSASKEGKTDYVKSFIVDLKKNPARAFHGSFYGSATITNIASLEGDFYLVDVIVRLQDEMTALSGTRAPKVAPFGIEILNGYKKENPDAIYPTNNPYGAKGQFRTISIKYTMKISVVIKLAPSTQIKKVGNLSTKNIG